MSPHPLLRVIHCQNTLAAAHGVFIPSWANVCRTLSDQGDLEALGYAMILWTAEEDLTAAKAA